MSATKRPQAVTRIGALTPEQTAQMEAWADRWIAVGLRTGPMDYDRFVASARACYGYAGIPWPGRVVRVSSPLALALAAPIAGHLLATSAGAVGGAVTDAVAGAVRDAVGDAVGRHWSNYLGGQLWVSGGWYWGGAWTSFFREVCHLTLPGDLWDRARAYEGTLESACWWYPHRQFVMVCERPTAIHRELVDPARPRGWGSHRLHCETGPAVVWPDGWGVYAWHGTRVPAWVIETPADQLTVAQVNAEPNQEVKRVLLARMGWGRYLRESGATAVQADAYGKLYTIPVDADRTLAVVEVVNGTPEPLHGDYTEDTGYERHDDGRWYKRYFLRVPSTMTTAHEAVAWTYFETPATYAPLTRT